MPFLFQLHSGVGKSEVGVVLFGTPDTDNPLATGEGGYDNISVVRQLSQPDVDLLKYINGDIEMGDNNPADCIHNIYLYTWFI